VLAHRRKPRSDKANRQMTPAEELDALRAHARRWAEVGPELEHLRELALRKATAEELRQTTIDLLSGPLEWFVVGSRPCSGLIEQQRIFQKCRV